MAKYNIPALTAWANNSASQFWEYAKREYAKHNIDIGIIPEIKMNVRLTSTAGRAWSDKHMVDLSCYLMTNNYDHFHTDTIPHELCHIIACKHFASKGHDRAWYNVVEFLQVKTSRLHSMTTLNQAKRQGK